MCRKSDLQSSSDTSENEAFGALIIGEESDAFGHGNLDQSLFFFLSRSPSFRLMKKGNHLETPTPPLPTDTRRAHWDVVELSCSRIPFDLLQQLTTLHIIFYLYDIIL